jgi:hypothetical protein
MLQMANGTILDRAVQAWESEEWAYLHPTLGSCPQYELTHRIAEEYPVCFDESLFQLV